jgi:hypothetical protein
LLIISTDRLDFSGRSPFSAPPHLRAAFDQLQMLAERVHRRKIERDMGRMGRQAEARLFGSICLVSRRLEHAGRDLPGEGKFGPGISFGLAQGVHEDCIDDYEVCGMKF